MAHGLSSCSVPSRAHQKGSSPSLCLQLASKLKDTISTPIQSAKSTIGYSMDKILGLAVGGYETTRTTVETTARYTRSNSVSQMAAAGMDTALGGLEKLMEYLLPEEEEAGSIGQDHLGVSAEGCPGKAGVCWGGGSTQSGPHGDGDSLMGCRWKEKDLGAGLSHQAVTSHTLPVLFYL